MKTVNAKQPPFRHEFDAIALRHQGSNKEVSGRPLTSSLFFNSPYQVITWDILPDWKGAHMAADILAYTQMLLSYPPDVPMGHASCCQYQCLPLGCTGEQFICDMSMRPIGTPGASSNKDA
jgi:hypothetical protein